MTSAWPNRSFAPCPKRNTSRQRQSSSEPFPLLCRDKTWSGSPRRAPARPRRSRSPSCTISRPMRAHRCARLVACWCSVRTRELSRQILDSFRAYGRHLNISGELAIGGLPIGPQVRALLSGTDVLVATPGRLLDLVQNQRASTWRSRISGARRSGSHARHGIYRRYPQDRQQTPRASTNHAVLSHHATRHCRACRPDVARAR